MKIENKVIYQIYPKSFKDTTGNGMGDIRGIISKLDYIKELGVDYIWLSPINKSPQNDNGYDISDYYEIDSIFGTNTDYFELIKRAKKLNIKIMMDLVVNHVSTEHIWFKKALQNDPEYIDYFIFRDKPNDLKSAFSDSAWTYSKEVGKYYLHLFDKTQADLNWDNENVCREIYKMINYWIDQGIEGFRLDVIDLIGKEPDKMITARGPKFLERLNDLSQNTFQDKLLTVGECWNASIEDATDMTKNGLMQIFHFFHINWIYPKWEAKKITLEQISNLINVWQNEYMGIEALVQNNHDLPRYISYMFGEEKEYIYEKSTLLFMINVMLKGNIYIYQGEEIGMTNSYNYTLENYKDIETKNKIEKLKYQGKKQEDILNIMHKISRDNARTPMQWDNSKNAGFTNGRSWIEVNDNYKIINVEKDKNSCKSIYKMYKQLLKFRKDNYENFKGIKYNSCVVQDNILEINTEKFIVALNFSKKEKNYKSYKTAIYSNYSKENYIQDILLPYEGKIIMK